MACRPVAFIAAKCFERESPRGIYSFTSFCVWVINAILKAYELVPEAYHQKFRNYCKQESQTHVEFAHEKEVYFNRWCNSREMGTDFEKLRQVILIEEFKRCVCDDIKTYLDEHKVENFAKAAAYVDDYAVTHKSTFNKNRSFLSLKSLILK